MYKARYYKADGKKGRARALPEAIFDGVVNDGAMHQVVKAYLANQRQGTAAAKSRSDVAGGSRKPWRQKGTGRARQGTIRAVQWEGGGVAFPPIPHPWRQRIPKKLRGLARRSALNDRAENDRVVLADLPAFERPKTRELLGFLDAVASQGKTLVLTVLPFGDESAYDVLWAHTVVIERSAIEEYGKKKATDVEAAPEEEGETGNEAANAEAEPVQDDDAEEDPDA
jgi:large subunit ribosomal protein L4